MPYLGWRTYTRFWFFFPKSVTSYLPLLVDSSDIFSAIEFSLSSFSMEEAYEYLDKCGFQRNVDENHSQGEGQCILVTHAQAVLSYGTCWKAKPSLVQCQWLHKAGSLPLMGVLHKSRKHRRKYILSILNENKPRFWEFAVGLCLYEKVSFTFVERGRAQVIFFSMIQKYQDASTSCLLNYLNVIVSSQ